MPSPRSWFNISIVFAASCCLSSSSFGQTQIQQPDHKKVWTNDDLRQLAGSPPSNTTISTGRSSLPGNSSEKHYVRAKDPSWYISQLRPLHKEIEQIDSQLLTLRQARKDGRGTTGAVALDQEAEGITSDAQIQILEQRRNQLLLKIDAWEDQSRRNGLAPGSLRFDDVESSQQATATADSDDESNDPEIVKTKGEIEIEKQHLERSKKEAELLERNLDLQRRLIFSNPEYSTRHIGESKIISAQDDIKQKILEIEEVEQKVADLEEHLEDQKLNSSSHSQPTEIHATADARTALSNQTEQKSEAYWHGRFSELDDKIQTTQMELDVLQREWNVLLLQYDPNPAKAMKESITRKQINEHKKQIDEKKTEIRNLRQQYSDLEDDLRHSGGKAGWSRD